MRKGRKEVVNWERIDQEEGGEIPMKRTQINGLLALRISFIISIQRSQQATKRSFKRFSSFMDRDKASDDPGKTIFLSITIFSPLAGCLC